MTRAPLGRCALRALLAVVLLAAGAAALTGCATSYDKRGVNYTVRSGESIWRVARIFRTDVQTLAEYNNILDPAQIQAGMKLYIPPVQRGGFKKLPFGQSVGGGEAPEAAAAKGRRKAGADRYSKPIQVYRGRFIWPVDGKVVSLFGIRDGRRHDGIDISARSGTPIHAAAGGKVVFAGSMRGYGNLILLRHPDDLFTAYAHNSVNKVQKGQAVKQGQLIGKVGSTGRSTGPHLHFEIRNGQTARNPLFFLPERKGASPPRDAGSARSRPAPLQEEAEDEELKIPPEDDQPAAPEDDEDAEPDAKPPAKAATPQKAATAKTKEPAKAPAAKTAPAVKKTPAAKKATTKQAASAAGKAKAKTTPKAKPKAKATPAPAAKAKATPAKSAPKKAPPKNAVPKKAPGGKA